MLILWPKQYYIIPLINNKIVILTVYFNFLNLFTNGTFNGFRRDDTLNNFSTNNTHFGTLCMVLLLIFDSFDTI